MFFRKKPKRLYIPTTARWYQPPRYKAGASLPRRTLNLGLASFLGRLFQNRFTLLLGLAGALMIFLITLSFVYWRIQSVRIIREDFTVNSSEIEQELQKQVGKNLLFFPRQKLLRSIRERFPEFETIEIKKEFPGTLAIQLVRYPLVANLRAYYVLPEPGEEAQNDFSAAFDLEPQNPKKPEETEQKAVLNHIGQALFDQEENLELMTISIHSLTQPLEDRQQVIASEHMDYIRESLQYFTSSLNLEVRAVEYLPVAREIHIKTDQNLLIWLTTEKEFREQLDKLKTIYEPAELDKEALAYIDLRVKEKVIYCPRSAACARR